MAASTGDQIRVPFGKISTGVANIRQSYNKLQAMFGEMDQLVKQMSSTWDGRASGAYQNVQKSWNDLSNTLNTGLNGIGTKVDTARDNFVEAEKKIAGMWG